MYALIVALLVLIHVPIRIYEDGVFFTLRALIHNMCLKAAHLLLHKPLNIPICSENLSIFDEVLRECNLMFWLSEGTALGAVRGGAFIPYDDDVDVAMWYEDWANFKLLALPKLIKRGFSVSFQLPWCRILCMSRRGEKLDIDFVGEKIKCASCLTKNANCHSCDEMLPYLKNMMTIEFNGGTYNVPGTDYLEYLYGHDWRIPQKKK